MLRKAVKQFKADRGSMVAAGMAFYWFLAVFPAILAAVGIIGLIHAGPEVVANISKAVRSTLPGDAYGCIQGTSMASPHAAGVAALIVSQFGSLGADGDWKMEVTKVESILQGTAVDIGLRGYDMCFGNGRIDALRAVTKNTSRAYDPSAPFCPEYAE